MCEALHQNVWDMKLPMNAVFPEVSSEYQLPDPHARTAKPERHASSLTVPEKR